MSLLKKEDILKKIVTDIKEFDSEILGGKVKFKRMSAMGHDAIEAHVVKYERAGDDITRSTDLTKFRATCIAFSQVDDTGALLWNGDVEAVGSLPPDVVAELFGFYLEMNPKDPGPEKAKESLEKDPEEPSSLD
jgi:hypothetical protein